MTEDQRKLKRSNNVIISNYEILKLIGFGSFGKVYLANHIPTKYKVAIKIVNNHKNPNVKSKYNILKGLNHINIIKIFDYFEKNDKTYIVLEYISGGELFDQIKNKGPLKQNELSSIFFQLIKILKYLHKKNIYHRDLKLENILLSKNNLIKLIDFGSAIKQQKKLNINSSKNNLLLTKCGSINYCAPEILKGFKYNGKNSDIWSLGVILYVLSTGSLPFDENNEHELIKKILKCKINYPVDMPINIKTIIMKILVLDPNKRLTLDELSKSTLYRKGKEIFFNENILYDRETYKLKRVISEKLNEYINEYNIKNVNNSEKDILFSDEFQSILKEKIFHKTNWNNIINEEAVRNDFNMRKIKHALSLSFLKNKKNENFKNKTIPNHLFPTSKNGNLLKNLEDSRKLFIKDNNKNSNITYILLNNKNNLINKNKKKSAKKKLNHSINTTMHYKFLKKINNKEKLYFGNYSNLLNQANLQNPSVYTIKFNTLNNNLSGTDPNFKYKYTENLSINQINSINTIDPRVKRKKINRNSTNTDKVTDKHKFKLAATNKTNTIFDPLEFKKKLFSTTKKSINDIKLNFETRKKITIDFKNIDIHTFNNNYDSAKKISKNLYNMKHSNNNDKFFRYNLTRKNINNILLINNSSKNKKSNKIKKKTNKNLFTNNIMNTIRNDRSNFKKFRMSIKKNNLSAFKKIEISENLNIYTYNESNIDTISILKEKNNLYKNKQKNSTIKSFLNKANIFNNISKN